MVEALKTPDYQPSLQMNCCHVSASKITAILALTLLSPFLCPAAFGQCTFFTVINIPPDPDIGNNGSIGANTQLNLGHGGAIGDGFDAGTGSDPCVEVNLSGGTVGRFFEAKASVVNMSGGVTGEEFHAWAGSTINVSGGVIGPDADAFAFSKVNLSGGAIGHDFEAEADSEINVFGDEFRLDGALIMGLDNIGNSLQIDLASHDELSGTLSDGTPFLFTSRDGDVIAAGALTLTVAELAPVGPSVLNVPSDLVPQGIRSGQTLNLGAGGEIGGAFQAGLGSVVNIHGGVVGDDFEAVGATVTMTSGAIGEFADAYSGTSLDILGGTVGAGFDVGVSSTLNLSGGTLAERLDVWGGGTANIFGGVLGLHAEAKTGGELNIHGGAIGDFLTSESGSAVNIFGDDFRLDGKTIPGLAGGGSGSIDIPLGSVLSGTLSDGTPFILSSLDNDEIADGTLTLFVTPVVQGPAVINVPSDPAPAGIHDGQTLNLLTGGELSENFNAGLGSTLNVFDGAVGAFLDAHSGSTVNIHGGSVGFGFDAFTGSTLNISGGTVNDISASGAEVTVTGGIVDRLELGDFFSMDGGALDISGGIVGHVDMYFGAVDISSGAVDTLFLFESNATISGGVVALVGLGFDGFPSVETAEITGGAIGGLSTNESDQVVVIGGEFRINGQPIVGLQNPGDSLQYDVADGDVLSGTLSNGTPFAFSSILSDVLANGTITLSVVELPPNTPSVINVPADPAPPGLRYGQLLILSPGGIIGDHFQAGAGSMLNVEGGEAGNNLKAVDAEVTVAAGNIGSDFDAVAGSVSLSGGQIGSNFSAMAGTTVNVTGGTIANGFDAIDATVNISGGSVGLSNVTRSTVTISDGTLSAGLDAAGSTVNITGGTVGDSFMATDGTVVNLSGGLLLTQPFNPATAGNGSVFNVSGGFVDGDFVAESGSTVNFTGGTINGTFTARHGSQVSFLSGSMSAELVEAEDGSNIDISGGAYDVWFLFDEGSSVNVSGGTFTDLVATHTNTRVIGGDFSAGRFVSTQSGVTNILGGTFGEFDAVLDTSVNVFGTEFFLDGMPIPGLILGSPFLINDRDVTLTATLANGDAFSFDLNSTNLSGEDFLNNSATLTVTLLDVIAGDFDFDGSLDGVDADSLVREIVAMTHRSAFDLNGDGIVDTQDLDDWLVVAGAANLVSGNPYLSGDANLDGVVDGQDFIAWNANKFSLVPAWTAGDFNADGVVDGQDFILWNANKFQSADESAAVPEPYSVLLLALALLSAPRRARH